MTPLTAAEIDAAVYLSGWPLDQGWAVRQRVVAMDPGEVRAWMKRLVERRERAERAQRRFSRGQYVFCKKGLGVPVGPNVGERTK